MDAPTILNTPPVNALKEELFALESERLAGKIPAEEYKKHKDALDVTLQRALGRQKN